MGLPGLASRIEGRRKLGRKKLEMAPAQVRRRAASTLRSFSISRASSFNAWGIRRFRASILHESPEYESVIARYLRLLAERIGYQGLRPVYWCIFDRTPSPRPELSTSNHQPKRLVKYAADQVPAAIDPLLAGSASNYHFGRPHPGRCQRSMASPSTLTTSMWRWKIEESSTSSPKL